METFLPDILVLSDISLSIPPDFSSVHLNPRPLFPIFMNVMKSDH